MATTRDIVQRYLAEGMTQAEIARTLGVSKQRVSTVAIGRRARPKVYRPCYIYFAQAGEFIKIGIAYNVAERLRQLQIHSPEDVTLLGTINGDYGVEQEIHKRLASARHRGEWFRITPLVLREIGRLRRESPSQLF